MNDEHAGVVRVTTFTATDGNTAGLLEAVRSNARDATQAPGCFGAQVTRVREHPESLAVISRWRDRDALDAFLGRHEALAHRRVGGFTSGGPVALHYEALPD
jgi:quinol monooxygenase YgiN